MMTGRNKTISADEARWRAESDLDTLMRAEQIKNDSKRYQAALDVAAKRKAELDAVKIEAAEDDKEAKKK